MKTRNYMARFRGAPRALSLALAVSALLGFAGCANAQDMESPEPVALVPRPAPLTAPDTIAIGIAVAQIQVRVALPRGAVAINDSSIPYILPAGHFIAKADTAGVRWWFDSSTPGPVSTRWDVRPLEGETLGLNDGQYRGRLVFFVSPMPATVSLGDTRVTRLTAVNILGLESYLRGVVPREIGFLRAEHREAFCAQAVAARTYTVRNLGRRKALGFDLYATPDDQVYGGAAAESPLTDSALRATVGEVMVFDGNLVEAFYHSTCGGHTAARRDVWSGGDEPYLRGVDDQLGDSYACASSRYFRWVEIYSGDTRARLAPLTETPVLTILGRDSSGRIQLLQITRGDSTEIARGDSIRRRWPRPDGTPLRSTLFRVIEDSGVIRLEGGGWGHGIGMCQMGALGRARAGQNYRTILETYYPGTTLVVLRPATANGP